LSVSRRQLIRHLEVNGFRLIREGGNHSVYFDGRKMVRTRLAHSPVQLEDEHWLNILYKLNRQEESND